MTDRFEFLWRTVAIGAGATAAMDLWGLLLKQFGVRSLNYALLGRWMGHLPEGQWIHQNIAQSAPIKNELLLGWCTHYAIGITFAALLIAVYGLKWARSPSLLPALTFGIVTVVAPLFILQPALGLGIASTKTATPLFNSLKSVTTHAIFGLGLYVAALATSILLATTSGPDIENQRTRKAFSRAPRSVGEK